MMNMFRRAADRSPQPFKSGLLSGGAAFCFLAALSTSAPCALAQTVAATPPLLAQPSTKAAAGTTLAKSASVVKTPSKPAWQDLTPAQQLSLKPLAANWGTLGEGQKRKWIAVAKSYLTLAPAEQIKLHSRMTEWVSLSAQQRDQARLNFAQSKQLAPTQKADKWQAYQSLSPQEKQKLAIAAPSKPNGAAAAAKPVAPQKLAVVPVTRPAPKQPPRISAANQAVNRTTLLPHAPPSPEPAPTLKN